MYRHFLLLFTLLIENSLPSIYAAEIALSIKARKPVPLLQDIGR